MDPFNTILDGFLDERKSKNQMNVAPAGRESIYPEEARFAGRSVYGAVLVPFFIIFLRTRKFYTKQHLFFTVEKILIIFAL
jgi:hypothetical protein